MFERHAEILWGHSVYCLLIITLLQLLGWKWRRDTGRC